MPILQDVFTSNLQRIMKEENKKPIDVVNATGIGMTTFLEWYHGRSFPRLNKLNKLASYLGVDVHELLINPDDIVEVKETLKIPVFKSVSCGEPNEETDEIISYETLPDTWRKKGSFFGVRANGDSMYPKIEDGDILIVRKQNTVVTGDIAIVKVNGHEATCKKIVIRFDGITLQPLNGSYEALFFTSKQIIDEPITIIGKVVEVRKRL